MAPLQSRVIASGAIIRMITVSCVTICRLLDQNPRELDPGYVNDLSCNVGGDLMLRSSKTKCIYIQNLHWENKP